MGQACFNEVAVIECITRNCYVEVDEGDHRIGGDGRAVRTGIVTADRKMLTGEAIAEGQSPRASLAAAVWQR
ncbi:hypothetical protein OG226_51250 [Streptomyces sp. NBC_01261]|uniref:hypothetical protein n=1 Tax=Streptomyces sp. NBC_01261 TaxID=2903802 RepID=UPI002E37D56C|nr:hypothetical protein [Streptomyces sp. NBC_01261]